MSHIVFLKQPIFKISILNSQARILVSAFMYLNDIVILACLEVTFSTIGTLFSRPSQGSRGIHLSQENSGKIQGIYLKSQGNIYDKKLWKSVKMSIGFKNFDSKRMDTREKVKNADEDSGKTKKDAGKSRGTPCLKFGRHPEFTDYTKCVKHFFLFHAISSFPEDG